MQRQRVFIAGCAAFAVMLSVTINDGWPSRPPNEIEEISYPDFIRPGQQVVIKAVLDRQEDPSECIVGASLLVQFAGRLRFTRWTAQRVNDENRVEYVIDVPKRVQPGHARIFMRESYFCENRRRVAFVNSTASQVTILAPPVPDLPDPTT